VENTVSPMPTIEEKELGVKEYWYETFRRVVVVEDKQGCFLLSMDIYRKLEGLPTGLPVKDELKVPDTVTRLVYMELPGDWVKDLALRGKEPIRAEIVGVVNEEDSRVELVNLRLLYCGLNTPPSYEEVEKLYKVVTRIIGDIQ